jgi:hypothetical protein
VLLANQTDSEKLAQATIEDNGKGFGGASANFGTSLANQVKAGRTLTVNQLNGARRIALRHWGQAAEAWNQEREEKGLPTEAPKPEPRKDQVAVPDRFTWAPGDLRKVETLDPLFPEDETPAPAPVEKPVNRQCPYCNDTVRFSNGYPNYCSNCESFVEPGAKVLHPAPKNEPVVKVTSLQSYELFDGDEPDPVGERKLPALFEQVRAGEATVEDVLATPEWTLFMEALGQEKDAWCRLSEHAAPHQDDPKRPTGYTHLLSRQWREAEAERVRVCKLLGMDDAAKSSASYAHQWGTKWGYRDGGYDWRKSEDYRTWKLTETNQTAGITAAIDAAVAR